MRTVTILIAAVCLACSSSTTKPAATTRDPYATYLANNPDKTLILTRDDAQARALLGCETKWAPGTIDAVLHDAYKSLCP